MFARAKHRMENFGSRIKTSLPVFRPGALETKMKITEEICGERKKSERLRGRLSPSSEQPYLKFLH
jgi:hypothetical protein